jgi:V-type H+-transporting ATPase subunit a
VVWAEATLGILMGIDMMECFLHVLRLHWVEFQSKFFKGQGYKYTPFSFEHVIDI